MEIDRNRIEQQKEYDWAPPDVRFDLPAQTVFIKTPTHEYKVKYKGGKGWDAIQKLFIEENGYMTAEAFDRYAREELGISGEKPGQDLMNRAKNPIYGWGQMPRFILPVEDEQGRKGYYVRANIQKPELPQKSESLPTGDPEALQGLSKLYDIAEGTPAVRESLEKDEETQAALSRLRKVVDDLEPTNEDENLLLMHVLQDMADIHSLGTEQKTTALKKLHPDIKTLVVALNEKHREGFLELVHNLYYGPFQADEYIQQRTPVFTRYLHLHPSLSRTKGLETRQKRPFAIETPSKGGDKYVRRTVSDYIDNFFSRLQELGLDESTVIREGIVGETLKKDFAFARHWDADFFERVVKKRVAKIPQRGAGWFDAKHKAAGIIAMRYFDQGALSDQLQAHRNSPVYMIQELQQIVQQELGRYLREKEETLKSEERVIVTFE